jgi:hypothetical protein
MDAHLFRFYKLHVSQAYWIGGFGDEHYVGWLEIDDYESFPESVLQIQ